MKFAFIIHPLKARDITRKHPLFGVLPDSALEWLLTKKSVSIASEVKGIQTPDGRKTEGIFIGLPLTPKMFTETRPLEWVYDRILECCEIAEREGCKIIGLGAFTSVVGDGGITVAQRAKIAVTTGNSYTVATAIEGTLKACELVGIIPEESNLAVVGATGSIGKTCAKVLAKEFRSTTLIGRNLERTEELAQDLPHAIATTAIDSLKEADVIITVTSSDAPLIEPRHLKPGAVICDVARPRDVSTRVSKERPDVLVIEGGVIKVPGEVDFGINFGFPAKTAYACMSETMMLALEDRPENFTLGKDVSVAQVEETLQMAKRNGFELAGFRSFEKAVDQVAIERVKKARQSLVAL
ncbi:MAG: hypothetical protein MUC92_04505 [Fimbriimonadaceae bacterium]|nr:hypothetical protein [Fimbriimonadaceae bacterium]